jgi:hypothetical protein
VRNPHRPSAHGNGDRGAPRPNATPGESSVLDELLLDLAAGFGEPMADRRLKVYREALQGIGVEAVREAYAAIRDSDEYDRLPAPGRVRALAVRAEQTAASRGPDPEDLAAGRATSAEIDAIFAELKAAHPESPFVRLLLAERERYKGQLSEDGSHDQSRNASRLRRSVWD